MLAALRALGAAVNELGEQEPFLEVRCVVEACTGEKLAAALQPVAEQVAWLDLGNSPVDDASLRALTGLSNLTRLHLEGTTVTDASLGHLAELSYLECLNLHSTSVTDELLQHLTELPRHRALYLWQTAVTAGGAERLRDALPGLQINLGVTMPAATAERP